MLEPPGVPPPDPVFTPITGPVKVVVPVNIAGPLTVKVPVLLILMNEGFVSNVLLEFGIPILDVITLSIDPEFDTATNILSSGLQQILCHGFKSGEVIVFHVIPSELVITR